MTFEYKVVPAPTRGRRIRGVKSPAGRFAHALELEINALAAEGWEYLRTDTLPAEERRGLAGRTTVYQNMLVFRRTFEEPADKVKKDTARARGPDPVTRPDAENDDRDAEGTPLHALIETEIASARAPKLPSAEAAQDLPEATSKPKLAASRRDDMAAE
jgi:hypothetical protein